MTAKWRGSRNGVLAVTCLAIFIDMVLYGVVIPIQPRLLLEAGISKTHIDFYQTVLFGSYAVGLFLATPVFGVVSDRTGNRKVPMLLGLFALSAATITFAYVRTFPLLVIARLMQGVAAASTWVVGFAMVADAYPSDDGLGFALGIVYSSHTVGGFLGPLVGGFLGEYYGLEYPFLFCAALSLIDLVGRLIIQPPKAVLNKTSKAKVGLINFLKCPKILLCIMAILTYSSAFCSIELFASVWLEHEWGFSESRTSLCMLAFIVPSIIMGIIIGWLSDRLPRHKIIATGLFLHGLAIPLIPLSTSIPLLILFSALFGVTSPIIGTPVTSHLIGISEGLGGSSYARIYAIFNMAYSCGMILGPWLVGMIKAWVGFFWGMFSLLIISVSLAPIFWLYGEKRPIEHPIEEHLLDDKEVLTE